MMPNHRNMNDDLKGAHFIWNRLVNKKHRYKIFLIAPNTIEKLKEVAFAPRIRVSTDDWFLTKDGTESLKGTSKNKRFPVLLRT